MVDNNTSNTTDDTHDNTSRFEKIDDGLYGLELTKEEKRENKKQVRKYMDEDNNSFINKIRDKLYNISIQYDTFLLITFIFISIILILLQIYSIIYSIEPIVSVVEVLIIFTFFSILIEIPYINKKI